LQPPRLLLLLRLVKLQGSAGAAAGLQKVPLATPKHNATEGRISPPMMICPEV
jgi:hypothetical protein